MREIKFRAFADGELTRPFNLKDDYKAIGYYYSRGFIVEQFTGLHDKNGKEIYEGDIVRYSNSIENVVATISSYIGNNLYFCWHNKPEPPTNADIFGCKEELEVIGNIHENPELING